MMNVDDYFFFLLFFPRRPRPCMASEPGTVGSALYFRTQNRLFAHNLMTIRCCFLAIDLEHGENVWLMPIKLVHLFEHIVTSVGRRFFSRSLFFSDFLGGHSTTTKKYWHLFSNDVSVTLRRGIRNKLIFCLFIRTFALFRKILIISPFQFNYVNFAMHTIIGGDSVDVATIE